VLLIFFWRWVRVRILLIITVSFVFGLFRFGMAVDAAHIRISLDRLNEIHFEGSVATEPYRYDYRQTVIVETIEPFHARMLLSLPLSPRLLLGDTILFQCPTIQYNNLKTLCSPRSVEIKLEQHKMDIVRVLGKIKYSYVGSIERWLPSPHAQLLASILIGARGGFPRELSQNFAAVGLSHIVAISGSNITILIAFLVAFMRRLPFSQKFRTPILMGGIAFFTLFTGSSAATVRAAIMGCALLIASVQGRRALGFQLLLGAAFLMVLYDPVILFNDRGFQLSCAATFGLLSIAPTLTRLFDRIPVFAGMRDVAIQTIAASLATLPLIVGYFGQFSLISFFTNLLVVPLVPILMAIGFFWSVLAFIASSMPPALFSFMDPLVHVASILPWALLDYIISIAKFFASFPFPALTSASPIRTTIIIGIVYAAFFFLFLKVRKKSPLMNTSRML